MTLHRPLTPAGTVISKTRVTEIIDKGAGKGAVLYSERTIDDKATGERIAMIHAYDVLPRRRRLRRPAAPAAGAASDPGARARSRLRPADAAGDGADLPALRRPESAARRPRGGEGRGLPAPDPAWARDLSASPATRCSRASAATIPAKLTAIAGRFSAPVFPGETIRTEMWRDGAVVSFRARVVERDVVAINNGRAEIAL